jgi:hypothetical protein
VLIVAGGTAAVFDQQEQAGSRRLVGRGGGDATISAAARRRPRRHRPGCHSFCRQAGGIGDPIFGRRRIKITTQAAKVGADGIVRIAISCLAAEGCQGLLGLDGGIELGRDDLVVPGRHSAFVAVQLSPAGRRLIRRRGPVRATVTVLLRRGPGEARTITLHS